MERDERSVEVKAVIQRVSTARVRIDGAVVGAIDHGLVILVGVRRGDVDDDARLLAGRCVNLRVFDDEQRLMNRSLLDVRGSILVISQFTLLANCRKGRRPSFTDAASPDEASRLVEVFATALEESGCRVQTGVFGARMEVELINEGPVTVVLDTDELRASRRGASRESK
jgi:D-tyrosyl-tRNA(Tyr) deacylase